MMTEHVRKRRNPHVMVSWAKQEGKLGVGSLFQVDAGENKVAQN